VRSSDPQPTQIYLEKDSFEIGDRIMKAPRVMLGTGFVVARKATSEHCGKCPSDLKKKKIKKKVTKESVVTPVKPHDIITINQVPALGKERPAVTEKKWMQDVKIKRKGICTGEKKGGPTCPPGSPQYALAQTFKKTAAKGGKAAAKKSKK
jgi:hypothetical protein